MTTGLAVLLSAFSLLAIAGLWRSSVQVIDKTDPENMQVVLDIKQAMIRDQMKRNK